MHTRARPPWAELQANPHDWARHVRDQGPRQLPDQQLPYHPWHMAQPAWPWAGRNPAEHHCLLGNQPLTRRSPLERSLVFLVILFSLTAFMYHFHSRWMESRMLQSISSLVYPRFLSVKYPVYSRRALRICLLFLLWAWGCASIVNHGLVPGTRCNGYIA